MGLFRKNLIWIFLFIIILIALSPVIKKMMWMTESNQVLRIAVSSLPETYDAITRSEYFTNIVLRSIFDNLFEYENNVYTPKSGISWYNLSDSLTYIQINTKLNFHNGEKLSANDVKESINRFLKHPKSYFYKFIMLDSIEVKSPETLLIHHKNNINLNVLLLNIPIYSAKQLTQFDDEFIKTNPIGTGPYYLFYQDKKKTVLKKNQFMSKKLVYRLFDQIDFILIPSRDDQVNELLKGKIDFIINPPIERYTVLKNSEHIAMKQMKSAITMYMMFDLVRDITPDIPLPRNPLKDIKVRQAIAHSMNIENFIEETLHGNASALALPWSSSALGTDMSLTVRKYNPELSKRLLTEAGYPKGFPMTIHCIENKFYGDKELGEYVKKSLSDIGIEVTLKTYPSQEFYKKISTKQISCFITGYSIHSLDNLSQIRSLFYNSTGYTGTMNRLDYNNPELNQLIDTVGLMADNDYRRDQLLIKASKIVYDNILVFPFYTPQDIYAYSKKIDWSPYQNELKVIEILKR